MDSNPENQTTTSEQTTQKVLEESGMDEAKTSSGRVTKAIRNVVFALTFSAMGFCAGLGVNVVDSVKAYIEEVGEENPGSVWAVLAMLSSINTQCTKSADGVRQVLEKIENQK